MQTTNRLFLTVSALFVIVCGTSTLASAQAGAKNPHFDAELAKKLGADKIGMRNYVLVVLKTGPKDAEIKGKERDDIFKGHFANIHRLADEGKLVVAGPFDGKDGWRGMFIFNVGTVEEAQALTSTDPVIKSGIMVMEMHKLYCSAALMEISSIHQKIAENSF